MQKKKYGLYTEKKERTKDRKRKCPEEAQTLDLLDKDLKAPLLNKLKKLKKAI